MSIYTPPPELTKEQFLKRCEAAWDAGYITRDKLHHLYKVADAMHRLCGDQFRYFADFIEDEKERTKYFTSTLANDDVGYAGIQMMACLAHPCNICATNKEAWHTRWGFCTHTKEERES